jgi:hypothetical protein
MHDKGGVADDEACGVEARGAWDVTGPVTQEREPGGVDGDAEFG